MCFEHHHKLSLCSFSLFFFNDTATTEIYTLSLHDALPISVFLRARRPARWPPPRAGSPRRRSEEHTSELQSHSELVCRLLLEKKKAQARHISRASPRNRLRCANRAPSPS